MTLGFVVEDMMVTVCWTTQNLEGFIRTVKYIELAASNMLAITNLAICVNLALIVSVSIAWGVSWTRVPYANEEAQRFPPRVTESSASG